MGYEIIYPTENYKEELSKLESDTVIQYYLRPNPWLTYRTKGPYGVAFLRKVKITGKDKKGDLTGKLMLAQERDNVWWRKKKTINFRHIDHIVLR